VHTNQRLFGFEFHTKNRTSRSEHKLFRIYCSSWPSISTPSPGRCRYRRHEMPSTKSAGSRSAANLPWLSSVGRMTRLLQVPRNIEGHRLTGVWTRMRRNVTIAATDIQLAHSTSTRWVEEFPFAQDAEIPPVKRLRGNHCRIGTTTRQIPAATLNPTRPTPRTTTKTKIKMTRTRNQAPQTLLRLPLPLQSPDPVRRAHRQGPSRR
jgi:hypothetical protein